MLDFSLVQALFKSENCPPVGNCEYVHNETWYVTFESEENALKAYEYIKEEVKTFKVVILLHFSIISELLYICIIFFFEL